MNYIRIGAKTKHLRIGAGKTAAHPPDNQARGLSVRGLGCLYIYIGERERKRERERERERERAR